MPGNVALWWQSPHIGIKVRDKTTLIYADYSADERRDRHLVGAGLRAPGVMLGSNLSETQRNSDAPNRSTMWEGA
jgi:hypothetical protein